MSAVAATEASPAKTIASHCSASGDVCYGIVFRRGVVYLELSTAARYFDRYRLCVRPPGSGAEGLLRCGSFPILRRSSGWGSSVNYKLQYPGGWPGTYRVTWKL